MRQKGATGVQTHQRSLKLGLEQAGNEVLIINSFSSLRWLSTPVYAIRPLFLKGPFRSVGVFWYRYWHYLFLHFALKRLVLKESIDVVAAQCPLSAKAALRVRSETGQRFAVTWTCHFVVSQAAEFAGKGDLQKGTRLYASIQALEREIMQSVDCVIFVSDHARRVTVDHARVTPARSCVIHNGTQPPQVFNKLQRNDLGLRDDAFVIVSVGALEPNKNQAAFIEMLSSFLDCERNCQILLVGEGQDRQKIAKLVREHGQQDNVILLGIRNDVDEILPLCDLYCHPAKAESFGLAVAEAMSHGLPVIAAPVGGIPEFVTHNESGLLIECSQDQSDVYIKAIRRLMQDPEERRRLSQGAKRVFEDRLTLSSMTSKYDSVFKSLTESSLIASHRQQTSSG
jgi:glycosyltransferase involved in cell wall biosynthesis